jgi:hypothetical protein
MNIEGAEDERTRAYFEKHALFPPQRDVEITMEAEFIRGRQRDGGVELAGV